MTLLDNRRKQNEPHTGTPQPGRSFIQLRTSFYREVNALLEVISRQFCQAVIAKTIICYAFFNSNQTSMSSVCLSGKPGIESDTRMSRALDS